MAKPATPKEVRSTWGIKTIEWDKDGLPIRAQCTLCEEVVIFKISHGQTSQDDRRILEEEWTRHPERGHAKREKDEGSED